MVTENCCGTNEEVILKKLTLKSDSKDILIDFVDVAKDFCEDQMKECQNNLQIKRLKFIIGGKITGIFYLRGPKRPIETLYLKEGQKELLLDKGRRIFDRNTLGLIIYPMVYLIKVYLCYMDPGAGKTSTINTVASHFDCDIYHTYFKRIN